MKTVKYFVVFFDKATNEFFFYGSYYTKKSAYGVCRRCNSFHSSFHFSVVNVKRLNQLEDRLNIDLLPF